MNRNLNYLFTSERLGFREWRLDDLPKLVALNSNREVMRYFPTLQSREQSLTFIERMQVHQQEFGFCYFVVEDLSDGRFVGFIGTCHQTYIAPFTPCIDIGWRLLPDEWGKGFAVEGALATLKFLSKLKIEVVYAIAPKINLPSIRVMEKIGMRFEGTFDHPGLTSFPELQECVYYRIKTVARSH